MSLRDKIYRIIFKEDTFLGRLFDILLLIAIMLSVLVVMLDSVKDLDAHFGDSFYYAEWFFTLLFTVEYILRLWCIDHPLRYARSFYGVVDLIAILPTYLSLLLPGTQYLLVVRVLRMLRVFRILKFVQYVGEANLLAAALRESRRKIFVFLFTVLTVVIIFGSVMYLVEYEANTGFTSIPRGVYWAIVTMTTVGYGDISPQTIPGQMIASIVMILGYSIIALPTGIVTVELDRQRRLSRSLRVCQGCSAEEHDADAKYCKYCGDKL